jgi:hypothetical protein
VGDVHHLATPMGLVDWEGRKKSEKIKDNKVPNFVSVYLCMKIWM